MSALTLDRQQRRSPGANRDRDGVLAMRLAVAAVGLYRGINLTGVLARGEGITTGSMAVAVAVVAVWDCLLVWDTWRRGTFRRGLVAFDVVVAVAVGLLGLGWGVPGMRFSYGVLQGTAIVAGYALPAGTAAIAVSALVGVNALGVLVPPESKPVAVPEFVAYALTLVALALAGAVAHRLLHVAAGAVRRRRADAAEPARDQLEQRRVLHDTALATLTAIANGVHDVDAAEVRARCARDAAYLRMIMQGGPVGPDGLPATLATLAADAVAVGLRVSAMCDALPSDLDPAVASAMAMAVREALNNVHRHAHTTQAWLSAAEENGRVVVRVVDRGTGFAPARTAAGSGIRDSICARMREVGGGALVESAPGEGTCVELRWPK
jgi:signal transduction histidine kinase